MTTEDFITMLFCQIDDQMHDVPKHAQAALYPSELVTLGMLFALKGVGERAFYRWLSGNYHALFPQLPERTRLFRLLTTHRTWADRFLAAPSLLGVADTYGIELLHPRREGRSPNQLGQYPGHLLSAFDHASGGSDGGLHRQQLPWPDGRPSQYEGLPAWHVEHPHVGGNRAVDVDDGQSSQTCQPSDGRLLPRTDGVHRIGVQCLGAVAWARAG